MSAPTGRRGAPAQRLNAAERQRTGVRHRTEVEHGAVEPKEPSFLERQREARPWLDHFLRAGTRYNDQKGDYYAAGVTYYTVLAIVPIVMVAFAIAGFVLAGNTEVLDHVRNSVSDSVPENLRGLVTQIIDSAISSKGTVGIIGLVGAAYSGLGWMSNIREALTAVWEQHVDEIGFVRKKLGDLGALLGLGLALIVSVLLSVVGGAGTSLVIDAVGLDDVPGAFLVARIVAILLSIATSWVLFIWVIARLPREPVGARSAVQGALLAALLFEVFKQAGSYYLRGITSSTAGSVFGPILGVLVFIFFTARMILFATAYAATTRESLENTTAQVPGPAVVTTQVHVGRGPGARESLVLVAVGAAAALGVTWRRRR